MHFWTALAGVLSIATAEASRSFSAKIDVLAYADVYEMKPVEQDGMLVGGPSRVIPIVKDMREKNPNSLVLFSGDTMSPSLWSSQFHGMQMVEAHNAIGVDAACLGNHEFDFGLEGFRNVSEASNFPWLNANVYENATDELLTGTQANLVLNFTDVQGKPLTIGFFGVMYQLNSTKTGAYWTDPIEAAREQVKVLRDEKKVDMVIALTHQTYEDDNVFSDQVDGIDVIYAGHDHIPILQTAYGTPYMKTDQDFKTVWRSTIEFFPAVGDDAAVTDMKHDLVSIVEDMPTDPELDETISAFADEAEKIYSKVIGSLCMDLDITQYLVRGKDAPIGHLFTDSFLDFYKDQKVDASVMNGGGIRGDNIISAGDLTLGDVVALSPFGNLLMVIETDGASLKKYIESEMQATCGYGSVKSNGFFVHPGGFKYEFACTGNNAGNIKSIEWLNHPTRSGTIQDSDTFVLALSDFLYQNEFLPLEGMTSKVLVDENEAKLQDAAVENYIKALPDKDVCLKDESRVTVTF